MRDAREAARRDVSGQRGAIYNWTKQEKIDRGEIDGLSTDQAMELAAARRRIKQLETELAVSGKVNEVFLSQELAPKACSR
jgi:hypothetical protein